MRFDLAAYDHLVTHIVPGPKSLSYFVPLFLLPAALLVPSSVLPRWQVNTLILPIITGATVHAWSAIGGVDVISVEVLLWSFYLLAFHDVQKDFRRVLPLPKRTKRVRFNDRPQTIASGAFGVKRKDAAAAAAAPPLPSTFGKSCTEISYPTALADRLGWVGTLLISLRLTNWHIEDPSHDARQPAKKKKQGDPSHARFFVLAFLQMLGGYVVLDLTAAYISGDEYFHDHAVAVSDPLPASFVWPWLPPRLWRSLVILLQAWALISPQYHIPCIIPVLLHWAGLIPDTYAPHLWPSFFGSPSVLLDKGLRGLWGSYWHQTLRHAVSGPGQFLSETLGLRRGSLERYSVLTVTAFFFSGIVHMGLVPPKPLYSSLPANTIRLLFAGFFWVQPVGMLTEVVVATTAKKLGCSTRDGSRRNLLLMKRLANLIWLLCWGSTTLPLLGEAGRQMGYWRVWPIPVSFYRGLKHQDWLVWKTEL
ncbi:hypothetical protein MBLNU459_g0974t1 [Dothideomycetes sp. NU459]